MVVARFFNTTDSCREHGVERLRETEIQLFVLEPFESITLYPRCVRERGVQGSCPVRHGRRWGGDARVPRTREMPTHDRRPESHLRPVHNSHRCAAGTCRRRKFVTRDFSNGTGGGESAPSGASGPPPPPPRPSRCRSRRRWRVVKN